MQYWSWLVRGTGGLPGYTRLVDRWVVLHALVGLILAITVQLDCRAAANTVLLPLAGLLIGLCFAWGGNANALLQTAEVERIADENDGGMAEYAFLYQSSILIMLLTLGAWGIAGLGVFDDVWPGNKSYAIALVKFALYAMASFALRECWHVVGSAQTFLIARSRIRQVLREQADEDPH